MNVFNETVFLGGCPVIRPEGIYLDGHRVIRLGLAAGPTVTWVDWYNAHGDEQDSFDEDAAVLDDTSTTPQQKQNYIDFFGGSDGAKAALQNYVATGGRAALFAAPAKDYGTNPIAVIKPAGPIERAPDGATLHPGTYTYSNVTKTGDFRFDEWVRNNAKTVKSTVLQTSAAVLPGGASYYTDNLIIVYRDTLWPSSLSGLPTWLPPGTDPIKYWGEVTRPSPAEWPEWPSLPSLQPTLNLGVVTAIVAVVLVGGGLLVYYLPRRAAPPPAPPPQRRELPA